MHCTADDRYPGITFKKGKARGECALCLRGSKPSDRWCACPQRAHSHFRPMTFELSCHTLSVVRRTHLVSLVTKEMDLVKALVFNVTKSIRLVPSRGEHIKGDLTTNGECESIRPELLLEYLDKLLADMVFLVTRWISRETSECLCCKHTWSSLLKSSRSWMLENH
jgi:hypothetical protein